MPHLEAFGDTPQGVAAWLTRVRAGTELAPSPAEDVNSWLGLLVQLRSKADQRHDLAWARVALAVYAYVIGKRAHKEGSLGELSADAMMYRVHLMACHGVVPGDDLLDPGPVLMWVGQAVRTLTVAEARALVALCWHRVQAGNAPDQALLADFRRLRWIKNRLNVARQLALLTGVQLDHKLQSWLPVWDELP